jgi:hypothetical protein
MKALPFASLISTFLCAALVVNPVYAQAQAPAINAASDVPEALQIKVIDADQIQTASRTGAKQSIQVLVSDSSGAGVANAAVTCRLPETGPTGTFSDGTHAAVAYTDPQGHATLESVQWGDVAGPVSMRLTATKGTVHTGILVDTTLQAGTSPAPVAVKADTITVPRETTTVTVPVPAANAPAAATATQPTVSVTKPGSKGAPQPGEVAAKPTVANPNPDKLTPAAVEPAVSVSRTSAADAPHSSHAKWYVLALVAVAAGAGAGFAMKGKSSTAATTPSATISIGTPTVSVGH